MPHSHVTDADIALFVSGRLRGPAFRRFLRALSTCPDCRGTLRFHITMLQGEEAPPPEAASEPPAEYEAALDAAFDRVEAGLAEHIARREEEKAGLARLRARGEGKPFDGDYKRFKHLARRVPEPARIEHLLELSFEMRYRDPEQMWILARGAASAAGRLAESQYTLAQKDDLRARTQIELANAFRLNHDFQHAENCLEEAATLVEEGRCDPQTEGRLMDVHASLLMDQRQLDAASNLLDELHRHYLSCGETHLAGRALISKGIALHYNNRLEEAVSALRKGLAAINPARETQLLASSQQALLHALVDAKEYSEAGKLLMESGLRHAFADDPLNLLKLRGVEGKIFAGLGKLRRAEKIFTEVKEEFLRRDREYLVAIMGLELAGVLLRQGRADEVEPLAEEALEIFRGLKVGREALKAVRFLREACRQKLATAELVQEVVTFLSRLERQPGLRFEM